MGWEKSGLNYLFLDIGIIGNGALRLLEGSSTPSFALLRFVASDFGELSRVEGRLLTSTEGQA
ncbi:hypothetical protein IIA15_03500 [candidate division TA06 bacterium]|nr:hypothetical protein [candidate division TA06 bacterium]